jgi:sec-independent protein translocase protein TatA
MFGSLGVPELIFIFALALLIFGPRKLPEIGRTIGRGLSEFRKASTDLKRSINAEMIEDELRQSDPRSVLRQSPSGGVRDDPADASAGGASDANAADAAGDEAPAAGEAAPADPAPPGSVPRSADPEAT